MKLLVFGASGRCGRWVVRFAVERGHQPTVVVRPESDFEAPGAVRVVEGHVTDPSFVRSLITADGTIISCLGLRRSRVSPWSSLLSPPDLVQTAMQNISRAMVEVGGGRLIWMSAGGVGESRNQLSRPVRRLIGIGSIRAAYADLEAAETVVRLSGVDSVAVRPVTLLAGRPGRSVGPVTRYGTLSTIRRSDVARWMVDVADGTRDFDGSHVLLGGV